MHSRLFDDINALFVKYIIDFAYVKTVGYPVYDNGVPLITGIKRTVAGNFHKLVYFVKTETYSERYCDKLITGRRSYPRDYLLTVAAFYP